MKHINDTQNWTAGLFFECWQNLFFSILLRTVSKRKRGPDFAECLQWFYREKVFEVFQKLTKLSQIEFQQGLSAQFASQEI